MLYPGSVVPLAMFYGNNPNFDRDVMAERGGHFEIGTVTRHNTSPGSKALDLRLNFTVDLL